MAELVEEEQLIVFYNVVKGKQRVHSMTIVTTEAAFALLKTWIPEQEVDHLVCRTIGLANGIFAGDACIHPEHFTSILEESIRKAAVVKLLIPVIEDSSVKVTIQKAITHIMIRDTPATGQKMIWKNKDLSIEMVMSHISYSLSVSMDGMMNKVPKLGLADIKLALSECHTHCTTSLDKNDSFLLGIEDIDYP